MSDDKIKFELIGDIKVSPYDKENFELLEDFTIIRYDVGKMIFTIRQGFVFDFASVPHFVQSITTISQNGNKYYSACALLHDALYATQGHLHDFSKEWVDDNFKKMLDFLPTNTNKIERYLIWKAVDLFGNGPWSTFDDNDLCAIKNNQLSIDWIDK